MESIFEEFFGKNSRLRFLFRQFLKRSNIDAFLSPSTLKTEIFSRKKNEGMLCVYREIFDTIFNMSYWSGKSPMDKRVKKKTQIQIRSILMKKSMATHKIG